MRPTFDNKNYKFNMANPSPKPLGTTHRPRCFIPTPKEKARQTRRKRKLDLLVDSIMRGLTDRPSFDLRTEIPPLLDRQRSAGGFTYEHF
jgi:hypothetical protein